MITKLYTLINLIHSNLKKLKLKFLNHSIFSFISISAMESIILSFLFRSCPINNSSIYQFGFFLTYFFIVRFYAESANALN